MDSVGGLPSGPVDSRVSEQTGKLGANTFADPRTGPGQSEEFATYEVTLDELAARTGLGFDQAVIQW